MSAQPTTEVVGLRQLALAWPANSSVFKIGDAVLRFLPEFLAGSSLCYRLIRWRHEEA